MRKNQKTGGVRKIARLEDSPFVRKNIRSEDAREPGVRCLTNNFPDVRLASLASWREANEIFLWDRGGPYIVTQEGCDPNDLTMTRDEFVLGRSGKWLSLGLFFGMSIAERWKEFVFATGGEVLRMMRELPSEAAVWHPMQHMVEAVASIKTDEMAAAYHSSKKESWRAAE
jgi:hypothetical protein